MALGVRRRDQLPERETVPGFGRSQTWSEEKGKTWGDSVSMNILSGLVKLGKNVQAGLRTWPQ